MSDFIPISSISDSTRAEREREIAEAAAKASHAQGPMPATVDPLVLAFYLLLQASTVSSESAVIHAKQLKQNAISQQNLNRQAAELKWYSIPKEVLNHHVTYLDHEHWTWRFWKHGGFQYTTKQKITRTTQGKGNAAAISNAQAKNQQIAAERQLISDKLTVMQQQAQVAEGSVNSITDEAMQSMQEGSNLLDILKSLTFYAMLRRPTQG